MRAFFMLGEPPDIPRLRKFPAGLRSSEGGYSVSEGAAPDLSGTYFATTIARWARILEGEPPLVETAGFDPLPTGADLAGWDGDHSVWSSRDGMIVGKTSGIGHNDFLASKSAYGNFILKTTFKLVGGSGNSGIMFRAKRQGEHEMSGYQADVGENYWGSLYDESRRNKTLVEASKAAKDRVKTSGWNQYVIRAMGSRITLELNGVGAVQYVEPDDSIARSGVLGLQVHAGGPTEVRFKDLLIQKLPDPREDDSRAFGFHIRSVAIKGETRKYVLFIPRITTGRPAPVVLFLHGSGERGTDGVMPAMVGLGPAIGAIRRRSRSSQSFPRRAKPGAPTRPTPRSRWRRSTTS